MQDAPLRACRTRRTGHAGRRTGHAGRAAPACRTPHRDAARAAPGIQHTPLPGTGHAIRAPRVAPRLTCAAQAPQSGCTHVASARRRHCATPRRMQHAPWLHASTPWLHASTPCSPPASHDARVRCAQHPFHTSHARATGTALRTAHVAAPRLFAIARLSIRFTQCTVSLAASPLHPTP